MAGEKQRTKALVALDESEESAHALEWALDRILRPGDTVVLLHSQPLPPAYMIEPAPMLGSIGMPVSPDLIASFKKQQEHATNGIFANAARLCERHEMKVTTMVAEGDPRENICEAVVKTNADMLIMGSHGHGAIKRAFLGSVSDYCAHNVKCPVLIVKKPHSSEQL